MPMGRGLDQFIANRLTRMHVLQVVTDPAKADTIITDQRGPATGRPNWTNCIRRRPRRKP